MDTSDRTLINRFLGGDKRAFGEVVTRWERRVLNLAFRLTGDFEEALDVRQAAFMKAYLGLPAFNGEARFSTWLYRIVVNLCRDGMRSRRSREAALEKMAARPPATAALPPECQTERRETTRLVADAVAALPDAEREVVVLKHYHERSFTEISAIVGAPASTVKYRMDKGLRQLRTLLKNMES